ncbi:hypothetical protein Plhal304r1_c003g0012281 [Plasmopara halstedii]
MPDVLRQDHDIVVAYDHATSFAFIAATHDDSNLRPTCKWFLLRFMMHWRR